VRYLPSRRSPEEVCTNAALRRPPRDDFAACPVLRLRSVMWTNCFRKIMRITIARVVLARDRSQLRCGPGSVMIEMMRPRARASRDITVPIDSPVTSAISR
jgi:hypothetical protein